MCAAFRSRRHMALVDHALASFRFQAAGKPLHGFGQAHYAFVLFPQLSLERLVSFLGGGRAPRLRSSPNRRAGQPLIHFSKASFVVPGQLTQRIDVPWSGEHGRGLEGRPVARRRPQYGGHVVHEAVQFQPSRSTRSSSNDTIALVHRSFLGGGFVVVLGGESEIAECEGLGALADYNRAEFFAARALVDERRGMGGEDGVATERHQYQLQDATSDRGFRRPLGQSEQDARRHGEKRIRGGQRAESVELDRRSLLIDSECPYVLLREDETCGRLRRRRIRSAREWSAVELWPVVPARHPSLVRPPTGGPLSRPHPRGTCRWLRPPSSWANRS